MKTLSLFAIVGEAKFGDMLRTARVMNYCASQLDFNEITLASAIQPPEFFVGKSQQIPIMDYDSFGVFEARMLHLFNINSDYMMTVHQDGFILNPDNWSDDFLKYDYIGAPWEWQKGSPMVGNGGFCIRSRRLMEEAAKLPYMPNAYPADVDVVYYNRKKLEAKGCKFAPVELAYQFSNEEDNTTSYGFHGKNNAKCMVKAWGDVHDWEKKQSEWTAAFTTLPILTNDSTIDNSITKKTSRFTKRIAL